MELGPKTFLGALIFGVFMPALSFAKSCDESTPKRNVASAFTENVDVVPEIVEAPQTAVSILTKVLDNSLVNEEASQNLTRNSASEVMIDIDPEKHFQEIWGFGATITKSCLANMKKLSASQRKEMMEKLFSSEKGAGFSYLRVPIGANDYADSDYTLADTPNDKKGVPVQDPKLKYFDFKKDKAFAEFIKEARKINPNIQLMISPWTPPAWMKSNKKLRGGVVNPEAYDAYARYLIKTLDAYKKEGIDFAHMSIMNEPLIGWAKEEWNFPQAYMETSEQKKFIASNFGPLLKSRPDVKTRLLLVDHNWEHTKDVANLLSDPQVKEVSAGAAFHCYGGQIANSKEFIDQNPGVTLMQTECTASFSKNPIGGSFRWWLENQSLDAIRVGASGALGWNICLDQKGEPRNNGCLGCQGMVTIDQSDKKNIQLRYNEEYYALAQTSKFLQRGAIRISSTDSKEHGIINVAFLNPDGSRVVVMRNSRDVAVIVSVRDENCNATKNLIPAGAAISLKWQSPQQLKKDPNNNMSQLRPDKIN